MLQITLRAEILDNGRKVEGDVGACSVEAGALQGVKAACRDKFGRGARGGVSVANQIGAEMKETRGAWRSTGLPQICRRDRNPEIVSKCRSAELAV